MINTNLNRRQFLKTSATIGGGAGAALSGMAPIFSLASQRAATPIKMKAQNKALVFIMLDGGNDSFNMLVPTSSDAYDEYQKSRSNLAIAKSHLLPLNGFSDKNGKTFGLHPAMKEVQTLFNQKKLAFVANIGPMIEPVTKENFKANSVDLPLGLMSHADQFKHWQTANPGERLNKGWLGYFADILQANKPENKIPMNISLAGNNIMQNGNQATPYAITEKGSVGLEILDKQTALNKALFSSFTTLLNTNYGDDPFKQSYLSITRQAQAQHETFKKATSKASVKTSFSSSDLSQELKKVAESIASADDLDMRQQTFFIRYIGWDHHDELLKSHAKMLGILSKALGEFQTSLNELGVADKVITFTGSDFGRTLTSNGNGTDHGWGGNTLVMGNAIDGGKVFGSYPELTLDDNNPLDAGDGVLIPTTAIDELYAELALWFGVERKDLNTLFPNLNKFYSNDQGTAPLGVVKNLLEDYLFDWAEQKFPQFFSPAGQATQEISGFKARHYADKKNYVGIKEGKVYVYGPSFNGMKEVGKFSDFLKQVSF